MGYRDVYKMTDEQISSMLLDELYIKPGMRRKELIEVLVARLGFSEREKRDQSPESPVIKAKARIGMVLSACMKSGYVTESETGVLTLVGTGKRTISREKARDFVISQLEQGTMTRKQLYEAAEHHFGTDKTPDRKDDNDLRSVIGKVLSRLVEEQHVFKTSSGYRLTSDRRYPNTEMGSCLRAASHGGDIKKCFLNAIHIRGGEWFESYCVELLTAFYRLTGKSVIGAAVTGGSDDGGIDGIIKTEDWLGYRETILMQMKNRNAVMTAKDVREFYGAVCAENGSRGVFITISSFHLAAQELIAKVDNLIGINGDKLFEIASRCELGLKKTDAGLALDEEMFLSE